MAPRPAPPLLPRAPVGHSWAMLTARAPAKINLTLHVVGRRADGYHALESLVAFARAADRVGLAPGPGLSLTVEGPTAALAGPEADNLVLKAARLLAERVEDLRLGAFLLMKRLPVAAGLGGGSADAAAALRLIARLNKLSLGDPRLLEAARLTGSDVPVCLEPLARTLRGAGEEIGPRVFLPPLHCVLVNPGVPMPTPKVFEKLGLAPGVEIPAAAHPPLAERYETRALFRLLRAARNDLEAPAIALAPAVGDALHRLRRRPGCRLARMSGSGATVFGLFGDETAATAAAKAVRFKKPDWWVEATTLR